MATLWLGRLLINSSPLFITCVAITTVIVFIITLVSMFLFWREISIKTKLILSLLLLGLLSGAISAIDTLVTHTLERQTRIFLENGYGIVGIIMFFYILKGQISKRKP